MRRFLNIETDVTRAMFLRTSTTLLLVVVPLLFPIHCAKLSIREINFYDEKTALENQILGTYKEIETDTMVTTSYRAAASEPLDATGEAAPEQSLASPTSLDNQAIQAFQNRLVMSPTIDEYRAKGIIKEAKDGYCIPGDKPAVMDDHQWQQVLRLCGEENRAREQLIDALLTKNSHVQGITREKVQRMFQAIILRELPPGTAYQTSDDQWKIKDPQLLPRGEE